ncbi:single-stranded DNA-binding protein [Cellulomonas sp.]|uniref:single-stranded DNA-binding protein n=1 Tax=Cellulomonas sp. TaxID=40001 RepID=UPI001B1755E9|nr:single-stranded DNA-binding protein [Cellulomonas sp.]MBO9554812.1 single-stranded DNA-binding protein [Cellulomonas sp.]
MSTHTLDLTLVGWIGSEVRNYPSTDGSTEFTSFRMASTRRWFDRRENVWKDGRTEWFTVKLWRQAAQNAGHSLRKGDPVVVHGRLSTEEWASPEGPRTTLVIEAAAVGHDLTFGTTHFRRTLNPAAAEQAAEDGVAPADVSGFPEVTDEDALVPAEDVAVELEDAAVLVGAR